jgi:hypothetical protein
MSTVSGLGGGASNLLWALYQNASTKSANATSAASSADSTFTTSNTDSNSTPADATSEPGGLNPQGNQLDSNMLVMLIDVQGQSSSAPSSSGGGQMADKLFSALDQNGDSSVSQSELEQAFSAAGGDSSQADTLFKSLDSNNDGTVGQDELQSAMKSAHHGGHHHHHADAAGASGTDPMSTLLSGLQGGTSDTQSTTGADGSTSTVLSFSELMLTSQGTSGTSTGGTSSNNASSANASIQAGVQGLLAMLAKLQGGQQQSSSISVNA